jgi:hypothetical protein
MRPSAKAAVIAALIEGQRNRLRNEAKWREEDPLSGAAIEPADPASPPAATTQPRPEPQLNLPHLGDIWHQMQAEKQSLGAINLHRMGQAVQTGTFNERGVAMPHVASDAATYRPDTARVPSPSFDTDDTADHGVLPASINDGRLGRSASVQDDAVMSRENANRAVIALARSPGRAPNAPRLTPPNSRQLGQRTQAQPLASASRGKPGGSANASPVPFRLRDGSTIHDPDSRTGILMQPPTVDLASNAKEAKSWWGITASSHMAHKLRRGGEWDYQRTYGVGGKINRDYINIGNYNYGVVAAAAGYTPG